MGVQQFTDRAVASRAATKRATAEKVRVAEAKLTELAARSLTPEQARRLVLAAAKVLEAAA